MIKLRFSRDYGVLPALIRTATWFHFDHVELLLPYEGLLGSSPQGGVAIRPLDWKVSIDFEYASVACDDITTGRVLQKLRSQIGKPYDYSALLHLPFGQRDWRDKNQWTCSELIAWSFEESRRPILNAQLSNRLAPRDIYLSPHVMPEREFPPTLTAGELIRKHKLGG
jgi:uncharacterized protein YycO